MSSTPRYLQIAAILRARIDRGELPPGAPVPSEPAMQQEFGTARNTVRHAIEVLRDEDLVVTVPGVGTFVR